MRRFHLIYMFNDIDRHLYIYARDRQHVRDIFKEYDIVAIFEEELV